MGSGQQWLSKFAERSMTVPTHGTCVPNILNSRQIPCQGGSNLSADAQQEMSTIPMVSFKGIPFPVSVIPDSAPASFRPHPDVDASHSTCPKQLRTPGPAFGSAAKVFLKHKQGIPRILFAGFPLNQPQKRVPQLKTTLKNECCFPFGLKVTTKNQTKKGHPRRKKSP